MKIFCFYDKIHTQKGVYTLYIICARVRNKKRDGNGKESREANKDKTTHAKADKNSDAN